ncbi:ENTH-domain-containing protein [Trametes cingulata]|nr:ENTH-domain-containing protein [Trametes cingulata]
MDRLESLGNALSQITLYDIKSMVNQAKNVVFNVSEMEAKVREATNDEPWGASSTLMQEIAQGTFNFQNFNEIMPAIYSRFMEKEARQWRQIYKACSIPMQYLVKNGSERVVDDARSHIATIKMLRNFYYVDEKGKDQGINVRNRSKELVELLGDVEKIRAERRKAKANRNKYTGVGNDPMSFGSGGRYGGFGSESLGYGGGGSYSGGSSSRDYDSYGDGGSAGFSGGFRDSSSRRGFQEYDAGDDDAMPRRSNSVAGTGSSSTAPVPQRSSTLPTATAPEPKGKQPEVDLLGMDDDAFSSAPAVPADKALPALGTQSASVGLDDDFDDFQSAPPSAAPATTPSFLNSSAPAPVQPLQSTSQPQASAQSGNNALFNMLSSGGAAATLARTPYMSPPAVPMQNPMQNVMRPAMMSSPPPTMTSPPPMLAHQAPLVPNQGVLTPASPPPRSVATSPASTGTQQKPSAATFDDLWSMSLGSSTTAKSGGATGGPQQKSIKDLEKEKAQAQIWGAGQNKPPMGAGFGSFGGAPASSNAAPPASSGNALDDLLF